MNQTMEPERVTGEAVTNVWVQIAPPHLAIVRAITTASACPAVRFDGRRRPMAVRAAPDSDFEILTCEAVVPARTEHIEVAGKQLTGPLSRPRRIAVIGDTGCRLKGGNAPDDGFQACNDPDEWEFAKVARQVAASRPDLIIFLGDYIYREQACPPTNTGCQGSPFNSPGMRLETWVADFFVPAAPMLEVAPIVFVRGDHEQCERAGRGFFRFLDPLPYRGCTDFTDPYALDFHGLQLVIMDTVQAGDTLSTLSPPVVIERYQQDFERIQHLATGHTWLVSHRPIWGVRPMVADGSQVELLNATVQHAVSGPLRPAIDLVLTGHVHLAEVLSFTGRRPPAVIVGTGGTKLLPNITKDLTDLKIDGEFLTDATILSTHGFVSFESRPADAWQFRILNEVGLPLTLCTLANKSASCRTNEPEGHHKSRD